MSSWTNSLHFTVILIIIITNIAEVHIPLSHRVPLGDPYISAIYLYGLCQMDPGNSSNGFNCIVNNLTFY